MLKAWLRTWLGIEADRESAVGARTAALEQVALSLKEARTEWSDRLALLETNLRAEIGTLRLEMVPHVSEPGDDVICCENEHTAVAVVMDLLAIDADDPSRRKIVGVACYCPHPLCEKSFFYINGKRFSHDPVTAPSPAAMREDRGEAKASKPTGPRLRWHRGKSE